ncbi:MAG: metal-dependent transcriptional regulator [Planctomycetes bacterium]|nr:metal-dependent transcriptional regulator [Planctomycetota bacterium]
MSGPAITPSSTVEDYIKCIYEKQVRRDREFVPTGQVATAMEVAPGTATTMMKTLAESGLVTYEPYTGVRLTDDGVELAKRVLRRHRVVELFLVEFMGMDWSEVHMDAELLEHAVSDRLIARMDEMLGSPKVDPHGDPIPSVAGKIDETDYPTLLNCALDTQLAVVRVIDQRSAFLRLLETSGLTPGSELIVESRNEEADSVLIRPTSKKELSLGFRAASKILVRQTTEDW